MDAPAVELVVARCEENLNWLRNLRAALPALAVAVYDKGPAPTREPGATALPNLGREAHSHLHHLATRYHALADLTVFVQGYPFDHVPDLKKRIAALAARTNGSATAPDFEWLGYIIDTDDDRGRRLHVPWTKNTERRELPMARFYQALFQAPCPADFAFRPGGQFIVSREAAHRRPRSFYENARALAAQPGMEAACCFERLWDRIFLAEGRERERLGADNTLYLRPTKNAVHPLAGDAIRVAPEVSTGQGMVDSQA